MVKFLIMIFVVNRESNPSRAAINNNHSFVLALSFMFNRNLKAKKLESLLILKSEFT